jgi:mannose-6-phosphate isomerase-like protein (cupin superfamily)
MAETAAYPYATHLDIKFDPLTLIDVSLLAKTVTDQWYNQTLCKVNESVIRLGVMQGEYHWHKHDNDDEFFFVLSGRFIIDLEGHLIELLPNQGFTVPKGVLHCTRAPERSMILMSRPPQSCRGHQPIERQLTITRRLPAGCRFGCEARQNRLAW